MDLGSDFEGRSKKGQLKIFFGGSAQHHLLKTKKTVLYYSRIY